MSQKVLENLKNVPKNSGVYSWKDIDGKVIYVGKAKNLFNRMHQYFEGAINSYKTHALVQKISDFEIFITRNDREALLLEKLLIEKFNPEYNILLLDDKVYPYIKIELKNHSLDISIVRRIKKKNSTKTIFFGPFPMGFGAGVIVKLLQREAFYENGLKISTKDSSYWENKFNQIKKIITFQDQYISELEQKMYQASDLHQFEIARDIRDSLQFLKKIKQDQVIELKNFANIDVIAYRFQNHKLSATILFYRHGNLIGKHNLTHEMYIDELETLVQFFNNYYTNNQAPDLIISEQNTLDFNLDEQLSLNFIFPKKGQYKKVLDIAKLNLEEYLKTKSSTENTYEQKVFQHLEDLKSYTNNKLCTKIVAFDNSNYANTNPVGVAVTYTNGFKNTQYYRKFNHNLDSSRQADVEYMRQSALKYFENSTQNLIPDLIIADGSFPQVNEIKSVLTELNIKIPVIGLVKDKYHRTAKIIDVNSQLRSIKPQSLKNFLNQIQIEVDRYAKSVFRNKKKIASLEGKLQKIKGIGDKIEAKLLNHFKNYYNIYNATLNELKKVVSTDLAEKIFNKEYLKEE
ncbi:uvrabc system subunit c [Mycoplasmopsis californica HAZ160_1]|uniref:Excinuclease cho n=1 Tax=Mycoplasmopsis californica HAZ160_1 TaxID=1397850 RepID=A0AAT9F7Z4_9BACT|nr:GIY-YIG nuclease family protein [Mycoplasmopsis californica]BAP00995.1 uvrabc system subunit c [Mycoplasmopsis californica HAZ160_1]BBG40860.1 uvrabc system subunit c [Mycoplasmopsis californica]BBG41454.1 uvrabc system subunit c [Mycoplasmopsis californica]BBG42047.1 uvrabc system subunit c [Mycoplasmopsis californica]BBG42630.1 uvrabc system subunit c [Mycoplasmopsis californica]